MNTGDKTKPIEGNVKGEVWIISLWASCNYTTQKN